MRLRIGLSVLSVVGLVLIGVVAWRGRLAPAAHLSPRPQLGSVLIRDVPHQLQQPDFCGEACVAMWLAKLGVPADQDQIFGWTEVDPEQGRGAHTGELAHALGRLGFRIGRGTYPVLGGRPETLRQLERLFADLHADLLLGVPSIVCMHYDDTPDTTEHFRLILGYDSERDEVVYHEPARADGSYRRMARTQFLSLWPLKSDAHDWTVVRLRLDGKPADNGPVGDRRAAGYAQHIAALRGRLPAGFTVTLAMPFVVVGDAGPQQVRAYATTSIAWAVRRLKESYFHNDPDDIIDIWLFKDAESYERNTKLLFNEEPETPYGYYSPSHHALFMNIATGGGTLVHEIVHPYLHANFAGVPPWFNEGLGSLYEQCDERDGQIVGLSNWRLDGLQERIRAGRLPTLRQLTAASSTEFYEGAQRGSGYGQARYLLYYLQERGLLVEYYRRFRAARRDDPTGYGTLQQILGETDMADFQRRWERWVLDLKFEEVQ